MCIRDRAIGLKAMLLLFPKQISQWRLLLRRIHSFHIIIIATPGYPHDGYRIPDLQPHFLPMSKIKSRNSVFSIFRRFFSYLYSCRGLAGFLPLCLGTTCIVFFRSRFSKAWIGLSPSSPRLSATSRWLIPQMCIRDRHSIIATDFHVNEKGVPKER